MAREHCPLDGTQMVEKPSAKWGGKYKCPECGHCEYDHSAIREDYINRKKITPTSRNIKSEYSSKKKV